MKYKFIHVIENKISYNALLDDKDRLVELIPTQEDTASFVGSIYIGRVANISKGINAAFVDIGLEQNIFLQIEPGQSFIYCNGKDSGAPPRIGDELLIQITKEAYLTKAATGTGMITILGRYAILTYQKNFIGISGKIKDESERIRLKKVYQPFVTKDFGFIVRTNAEVIPKEDLEQERDLLIEEFNSLMAHFKFRTCFQCVYEQPSTMLQLIRDLPHSNIERYIFGDEQSYKLAVQYFEQPHYNGLINRFQFYQDDGFSLFQLYGLKTKIDKALREKVWLDSGANLIIQPTEALTVIDVNSSKSSGKKNFEDTVFKINIEAAKEIVHQIRLRNLSGIIIIDFIDMDEKEHIDGLMNLLSGLFGMDRIKTTLVDMTPLGLVEVTRKKIGQNIYERFKGLE